MNKVVAACLALPILIYAGDYLSLRLRIRIVSRSGRCKCNVISRSA